MRVGTWHQGNASLPALPPYVSPVETKESPKCLLKLAASTQMLREQMEQAGWLVAVRSPSFS